MTDLLAGAGKSAIDIPAACYPVDGFAGECDRLQARMVLLENRSDRVALAVVDQTSLPDESLSALKDIVGQVAGVRRDNIVISASHTFSAPHLVPLSRTAEPEKMALLTKAVNDAVSRAAARAQRTLRSARIGFGVGASAVNVNRDVPTGDGWWLGANEDGESDKSVAVMRIEDLGGHPIAILLNYAVQSSVMNELLTENGDKLVTSDLAGAAARCVEERLGTVALFLIGAAGDQAPRARADTLHGGQLLVDLLGERLGTEVIRVGEEIRCDGTETALRVVTESVELDAQVAPASLRDIHPTKSYEFRSDGKTSAPITIVRIGDVVLVGLQAELSSRTGAEIKKNSPFDKTVVATMVNGAAKYLADANSYDRITYEAMNSRYAKGSAEILASRITEILSRLRS